MISGGVVMKYSQVLRAAILSVLLSLSLPAVAQKEFNAWLSTCSHLVGPTGNKRSLKVAVDQSRGLDPAAPAFRWDILIDAGDWTASQHPPGHEEGEELVKCLNETLGKDRGRFFTVSGNHDGEAKGWIPGEFAQKYVNPLGDERFAASSGFDKSQRPNAPDFRQLLEYPGTRWDRYLIRTGNVVWIMLGDRNEYDYLAEARGDQTGAFQAGRGSDGGAPKGGYPSGAVTLDTFEWWKKVVEDKTFSNDILITVHHHMLANTTITTEDGEPGKYHGKSGSIGPNGPVGGQLYWVREYNNQGVEIAQYAQTRPFLNYLRDHPGAIAAWIGGHSHIHAPESNINGRGLHVQKYGVTFISIGALTSTHAAGMNQMSRMITFRGGSDQALINVYIHFSHDKHPKGWHAPSVRRFPLGKKFVCPSAVPADNDPLVPRNATQEVPEAPTDEPAPRYRWAMDKDRTYDFNNNQWLVGDDGSPYGATTGQLVYSKDTPTSSGRSLDLGKIGEGIIFDKPFSPEFNWKFLSFGIWVKFQSNDSGEIFSYGNPDGSPLFGLRFDGRSFSWESGKARASGRPEGGVQTDRWYHLTGIYDANSKTLELHVDGKRIASTRIKAEWRRTGTEKLILGGSKRGKINALADDLRFYDSVAAVGSL